jgi:hypothetical protein
MVEHRLAISNMCQKLLGGSELPIDAMTIARALIENNTFDDYEGG